MTSTVSHHGQRIICQVEIMQRTHSQWEKFQTRTKSKEIIFITPNKPFSNQERTILLIIYSGFKPKEPFTQLQINNTGRFPKEKLGKTTELESCMYEMSACKYFWVGKLHPSVLSALIVETGSISAEYFPGTQASWVLLSQHRETLISSTGF